MPVRVYAPSTTPRTPSSPRCSPMERTSCCSTDTSATAARRPAPTPPSPGRSISPTLREPYGIEGKKTLGLELAMQLGWTLPAAIIYPTGGGTGLIGMWKAFLELRDAGWVEGDLPRMYTVQSSGCAPSSGLRGRGGRVCAMARSLDGGERAPRPARWGAA